MYLIKREAAKRVTLVCTRCAHAIRVQDFDSSKGHPRTQAAAKMLEHLSTHGMSLIPAPPKDVYDRSRWW